VTRLWPLFVIVAACHPQPVGSGCSYQAFREACQFVALERGSPGQPAAIYRPAGGGDLRVSFSIDDEQLDAFEAHLRAHPVLSCTGERIETGPCTPISGVVEIPAFEGAIVLR
jgi:hypothetical protein